MKPELAFLVDGDQVGPELLPGLLKKLEVDWVVSQRTAVRNFRSSKDQQEWAEFAAKCDVRCIQRHPVALRKNGADIELAIEAMDLLHGLQYRNFCIVSGDSDFLPLVSRLKRMGGRVMLIEPDALRNQVPGSSASAQNNGASNNTQKVAQPSKSSQSGGAKSAAHSAVSLPKSTTLKKSKSSTSSKKKELDKLQSSYKSHVKNAIKKLRGNNEHDGGWVKLNRLGVVLSEDGKKREAFGFAQSRPLRLVVESLGFKVDSAEPGQYRVSF